MTFAHMKLGRRSRESDPRVDRVPLLARLLPTDVVLPPPPRLVSVAIPDQGWILGQNDQIGDCTEVARANAILTLTTLAGHPIRVTDTEIKTIYFRLTGGQDTGLCELDVLTDWQRTQMSNVDGGIADQLSGYGQVNISNHIECQQAISLFGGIYTGAKLPLTCQEQKSCWSIISDAPWSQQTAGGWGGHAFWVPEYTIIGPVAITWGQRMQITWQWWDRYVDEAYALLDRDFLTAQGTTPAGMAWDQIAADLTALAA